MAFIVMIQIPGPVRDDQLPGRQAGNGGTMNHVFKPGIRMPAYQFTVPTRLISSPAAPVARLAGSFITLPKR